MKILISILLSLVSFVSFSQTTPLSFTRATLDFAPNKGFERWGTTDFGNAFNTAPSIPSGNTVAYVYYNRFNWQDIESSTSQGTYSWTVFDNWVHSAMDNGAMFSFGIMAECNACGSLGQIPTYVKNLMTAEGKPGPTVGGDVQPNYQSVNWVVRYNALLRAVAAHIAATTYNGHSYTSAFLGYDLRHYGEFGEGNGFATGSNTGSQVPSTAQITTLYMTRMVDSAIAIFPNVQLTVPMSYVAPNNDYVLSDGNTDAQSAYHLLTSSNSYGRIGWRRDNIGDDGYNAYLTGTTATYNPGTGNVALKPLIMNMWQLAPIGGEPAQDLTGTSRCGSIQCDLHNEISLFGMSYCGNGNYPILINDQGAHTLGDGTSKTHQGDSLVAHVRAGSAFMGFKHVLDSGAVTASPNTGGAFNITLYHKNIGIAPIYETWKIIFELWNSSTNVVAWRDTSLFSPKLFLPQPTDSVFSDHYTLTGVPAATYNLHVRFADPAGYKAPLPLAITGRQTDGSYILKSGLVVTTSGTPTANAGPDRSITLPTSSTTGDGTGSTGTLTSYLWTKISGPNTPTITNGTTATATFSGLIQGTYVFQLSVNGGVSTDQMSVVVSAAPPVTADAGSNQNISLPTSTASLDGSRSSGTITSYAWTQISGPNTPTISNSTSQVAGVSGLIAGTYVFQLSVNSGASTAQVTITVITIPLPPATTNVFTTQTPAGAPVTDGTAVTLGMKFTSSLPGNITGVRFYKGTGMTGTHTGLLYNLSGTLLASVVFTGETASGWQTMNFATPVPILANTVYIIAYFNPVSVYEDDNNYFASTAIVNGNLTGLKNGTSGGNGVYAYGSSATFPANNYQSTNYWVDPNFVAVYPNILIHHLSTITLWKTAP